MRVKSMDEARKIALDSRPGMKVENEFEDEKCFVINLVPESYDINKHGLFIGGSTRVDKETGEVGLYNPLIEGTL